MQACTDSQCVEVMLLVVQRHGPLSPLPAQVMTTDRALASGVAVVDAGEMLVQELVLRWSQQSR